LQVFDFVVNLRLQFGKISESLGSRFFKLKEPEIFMKGSELARDLHLLMSCLASSNEQHLKIVICFKKWTQSSQ
jgi:hypothetical protein